MLLSISDRRALTAHGPEPRESGAPNGPLSSAAVKRVTAALALVALATGTGACAAGSSGNQPPTPVTSSSASTEATASIVGTRWRVKVANGKDSSRFVDDSVWTFQPEGVLEFEAANPNEWDGTPGTWSRVGSNIKVEFGRYSYWDGELKGKLIVGTADNIADEKWAWEARQE